jgi:hypothetical protein
MGYTETDLRKMIGSVSMFVNKTDDKDVIEGLLETLDFLEGMIEEGRV